MVRLWVYISNGNSSNSHRAASCNFIHNKVFRVCISWSIRKSFFWENINSFFEVSVFEKYRYRFLLRKYKRVLILELESSIFLKLIFFIFRAWKVPTWNIRKFHFQKYKKFFSNGARNFYFRKYKKFFNPGARNFHFLK